MLKENDKIIQCPKCKSENVEAIENFDYVKQCNNDKCDYYLDNGKKWWYQWSTGIHN